MRINFFEEFPTRDNLMKAKAIAFPSTIYIAARSFQEFLSYRARLEDINPKLEAAYWPIIKDSYWISPFTPFQNLKALKKDLSSYRHKKKLNVLLDLELPLRNKSLITRNLFSFFRSKRMIRSILSLQDRLNIEFHTSVYPAPTWFHDWLMRLLGISYNAATYRHKEMVMYYTSMMRNLAQKKRITRRVSSKLRPLKKSKNPHLKNYPRSDLEVALGTIALGILNTEPKLSPKSLESDLLFLKANNASTAIIFRLGGLDKRYLDIIKRFI